MKLIAATRQSKLALWQTHFVIEQLKQHYPSLEVSLNAITTQGDKILDKPLQAIGGKALFMKELEIAMQKGEADFAVHSLKDVPYDLPEGFKLAAFCKREDPRDAFVSNHYTSFNDLPLGAKVGTSSLRRQAQLLHHRPDLNIISLRGNVQTRLNKLDEGHYDAIILAAAGLIRLDLKSRITEYLSAEICLPAVGQGVVVVEIHESKPELYELFSAINHVETEQCITAERSFNQALQGGCHTPIASYATFEQNTLSLTGLVASENGSTVLKSSAVDSDPYTLGKSVATTLIKKGAQKLLKS